MTTQERLKAQEERAGKIRELINGAQGRDFTDDEQRSYEAMNAEYDAEKASIDRDASIAARQSRLDALSADGERRHDLPGNPIPSNGAQDRSITEDVIKRAVRGWAAGRKARAADLQAARSLGIDLDSSEITLRLSDTPSRTRDEVRANSRSLNSGLTGAAGGYLVVPSFATAFEEAMLDYDDVRPYADVMRTDTGAPMFWPGGDDTSNSGSWVAVDQEASETAMAFSGQTWGAHTITSDAIRVDRGLLQDAGFDLLGRISRAAGTRIGRGQAAAFTTGDGIGKPKGVVTDAYLGKTAAATTSFTAEELMDLLASVGTAYARNGKIMCHRNVKWAMRKIKDGNARFLWEPQLQAAGMPDNILGYPIIENSNMASTLTTGGKVVLFGDFSHYKIRDVSTVTLQRLVEKYALSNQDAFVAFARCDGALIQSGQTAATKPVKYLALA